MSVARHLRVAVIRFPGSNCEEETALALASVGLGPWIHGWNEPARRLFEAAAVVLPGGFSFQDRVRAGALAGKLPLLEVVAEMAAEGRPVLGICNGAQILVEAGLVPGLDPEGEGRVEMCLASNRMAGRSGYYTRWTHLRVSGAARDCVFTRSLQPGDVLPMPVAHAEGRFQTTDPLVSEVLPELAILVYARPDGTPARGFPWNPNGSLMGAAAIMNRSGNVLGMMPHPERALWLHQVPPFLEGPWGERRRRSCAWRVEGPGWEIFRSLALHLRGLRLGGGPV